MPTQIRKFTQSTELTPSNTLSVRPSVRPSIHPSIHPPTQPLTPPFTYLAVHDGQILAPNDRHNQILPLLPNRWHTQCQAADVATYEPETERQRQQQRESERETKSTRDDSMTVYLHYEKRFAEAT